MFAREGYPFIVGATAIAVALYAAALRFRSWPFWLGALLVTILALSVAWYFRIAEPANRFPVDAVAARVVPKAAAKIMTNLLVA